MSKIYSPLNENIYWGLLLVWQVCYIQHTPGLFSKGDCLLDKPQKLLALPDEPPGTAYSLSRQCELAFGSGSKPCPYMQACSKLWCTGKTRGQLVCQTRHFPWADGTSCGNNRICYRGACTNKNATTKLTVRAWKSANIVCHCKCNFDLHLFNKCLVFVFVCLSACFG